MITELLSTLGGWWVRLWRRTPPRPLAVPPPAGGRPEVVAGDEDARLLAWERGAHETRAPFAGPFEASAAVATEPTPTTAEQCLIEVLGVDALPVASAKEMVADPAARDRTLAALKTLRQIPALQSLAQGFLRAMNRREVAVGEVIEAIEKDSALCVRVLRMANSVLVSPEQRIEDLDTAVQMLGVARVRKAAQALFTLRDANRVAEGFDWRHLWIHALATAAIAEELESRLRPNADSQIHLAGLLHDVGKIVLSTIAPDTYRDVLVVTWNGNGRLEELERLQLGVDHREAGSVFAEQNQLPAVVLAAIAHHDRPELAHDHRLEVALVTLANYLSKAHGLGFSGARLDERDGEFGDLSAWAIVEETCGFKPDREQLEDSLQEFITNLRGELRTLREET